MKHRPAEEMRRIALEAAAEIRWEHGPGAVTWTRVCERAGQSPAAMALLFVNQRDLRLSLQRSFPEHLERAVQQAVRSEPDPGKALRQALRTYINQGLKWPAQYRLCASQLRPPAAFETAIDAAVQASLLPSGDLDTATRVLWCLVHGITSALATGSPESLTDAEHWMESALDVVLSGARHSPCLPAPPPHRAA